MDSLVNPAAVAETAEGAHPAHWLSAAARAHPTAVALIHQDTTVDYASLSARVNGLCHALQTAGVQPGDCVVAACRDAVSLALLMHAALQGGFVLFPVNPALPDAMLRALLSQVRPTLYVADVEPVSTALVEMRCPGLSLTQLLASGAGRDTVHGPMSCSLQQPRLMIATSGGGGLPRVAVLSEANLLASVTAVNNCFGLRPGDQWLACLPLFHIGGMAIVLRCAAAAATARLQTAFEATRVMPLLRAGKVTHVSLVPAMLSQLLEMNEAPAPALRVALVGGAALPIALSKRAQEMGWPAWRSYGMSETAAVMAARPVQREEEDAGSHAVGRPITGCEVRIVDDHGRPAAGDGIIQLRGAAVMLGYADATQPEAYRPREDWLTTGDHGRLDAVGRLTVLGRADEALLSGGELVHPQAVEELLQPCPGVNEVAVCGRADVHWGQLVVAVYSGSLDEAALEDWCRANIQGVMRPRRFLRVPSLPRTASGKPDRVRLREWVDGPG